MASMGAGNLDPVPLIRILKGPRMLNKYLTAICKAERIPCAGAVKAIMQQRIQDSQLVSHSFPKQYGSSLIHATYLLGSPAYNYS